MKKCPWCAEHIQDRAKICRYCQRSMVEERAAPMPGPDMTSESKSGPFLPKLIFAGVILAAGMAVTTLDGKNPWNWFGGLGSSSVTPEWAGVFEADQYRPNGKVTLVVDKSGQYRLSFAYTSGNMEFAVTGTPMSGDCSGTFSPPPLSDPGSFRVSVSEDCPTIRRDTKMTWGGASWDRRGGGFHRAPKEY